MNNILVQNSTAAGVFATLYSHYFGLVFPVSSKYARLISKPNIFLRATIIMAVIACTLFISVFNTKNSTIWFGIYAYGNTTPTYYSYNKNDLETDKINLT